MEEKNELMNTSGHVALPFNEDQFKDFIVSLLGKPQTISKNFPGSFEIQKSTITTIHEILDQRITQQNDSQLIQFRTTVYYDDNSTVTLNGYDHLIHYNENLPLISKAVHLTWQYLIKFRDKNNYERQEINLSFTTNHSEYPISNENGIRYYGNSYVNILINHTARTWGADIEALLSKHLKTIVKEETRLSKYIRFGDETVTSIITGFLTITTLGFCTFKTINLRQNLNLDTKFWIHHYFGYVFLFIATLILAKIVGIIIDEIHLQNKPSFILLTNDSEKDKIEILKSYRNNWKKYFWTIFSGILLGIIGNYIYAFLTTT
ncbi:hypothetical protein ACNQGB_18905 [Flavobacterium sp. XS1P32]|uniref:hypothetical protein n=1 Tax=unclassified Flavobacterium TaxID=196869 RepID=UPI003AB050EB